jgi:aarF domain-containing kinase
MYSRFLLLAHCSFWQVLHPGLLSQVHMDLLLMKIGSRALGLLPGIKWLSLPEIVEEFEKLMVQQVNSSCSCK